MDLPRVTKRNSIQEGHLEVNEISVNDKLSNFLNEVYIENSLLLSRFSRVWLCATPKTAAHQAPPSLGFSRQEHWSGLPFHSPMHESEKWKWSRSVVPDSWQPHGLQPSRVLRPWDFPGKGTGVRCHCLLRKFISQWKYERTVLGAIYQELCQEFPHTKMPREKNSAAEDLAPTGHQHSNWKTFPAPFHPPKRNQDPWPGSCFGVRA